jgi:hypothetical protein
VPASSTGRAGSWPGLLEGYAQTWGPASAARKGSPGVIRRRSKLLEFQGNGRGRIAADAVPPCVAEAKHRTIKSLQLKDLAR